MKGRRGVVRVGGFTGVGRVPGTRDVLVLCVWCARGVCVRVCVCVCVSVLCSVCLMLVFTMFSYLFRFLSRF